MTSATARKTPDPTPDQGAIDALFEIGRGNLRATDQLARKTLEIAHHNAQDVCGAPHVAQARKLVCP